MRKHKTLIIALLLMAAGVAWIPNAPDKKSESYNQPMSSAWGVRQIFATANTKEMIAAAGGTGAALCVPYGSMVAITSEGGTAVCSWVMDDDLTFTGNTSADTACELTDGAGPDGPSACVVIPSGGTKDQVPTYPALQTSIGSRIGICTNSVLSKDNISRSYPGCDADADCTDNGAVAGTTCDTTISEADAKRRSTSGCVFIQCQVSANSTAVTISGEK